MEQHQVQTQRQELQQRQIQTTTQQQVLVSHLMELPINSLLDEIKTELDINPALEEDNATDLDLQNDAYGDSLDGDDVAEDFDAQSEREERESAFKDALENIGRDDDELPIYGHNGSSGQREEIVYGDEKSFYSVIKEQIGELAINNQERRIIEYIIGSIDDDGLLRKDLAAISDELAVYDGINVSTDELERLLRMIQTFEPSGIGARSLQECLLLQIKHRPESRRKEQMQTVISKHFDAFMRKDWKTIKEKMHLSDSQAEGINEELCKLNPKPGSAMGEIVGRNIEQVTPDVIIDTNDDGTITFSLNNSEIPHLRIAPVFADTLSQYKDRLAAVDEEQKPSRRNSFRDGLLYTRQKVEQAQMFIYAIAKRQETLIRVVKAIIKWQHDFFVDGDDAALRPMALRNIAELTGINLSTVSRVCNSKYVQTRWGIFPLRHFFTFSVKGDNGNDVSQRQVQEVLQEIIDGENKNNPLSDEALAAAMSAKGYKIARRTVAKYREQLGIPMARLRR